MYGQAIKELRQLMKNKRYFEKRIIDLNGRMEGTKEGLSYNLETEIMKRLKLGGYADKKDFDSLNKTVIVNIQKTKIYIEIRNGEPPSLTTKPENNIVGFRVTSETFMTLSDLFDNKTVYLTSTQTKTGFFEYVSLMVSEEEKKES